ncbi:hypothetical protein [Nostoc sp. ChiSLP03a]|nr:hypothetical protein [Nostoc sp. ChiSLP03a]MDZ8212065.1 hypothetical protein [Nostoc sp. ChiSLP03a]
MAWLLPENWISFSQFLFQRIKRFDLRSPTICHEQDKVVVAIA